MLPFLHERLRALGALLDQSSAVLAKYNACDLDLHGALTDLLDESVAVYRRLNWATAENRLLALQSEYVAAREGTNPLTLERVVSHRRALQRAVALRVLNESSEQVRSDVEDDTQRLADVTALLRPIVLAGIQRDVIRIPWPTPSDPEAVARVWRDVLAHPELRLAGRQVAMQMSVYDIHLLLVPLLEDAGA